MLKSPNDILPSGLREVDPWAGNLYALPYLDTSLEDTVCCTESYREEYSKKSQNVILQQIAIDDKIYPKAMPDH